MLVENTLFGIQDKEKTAIERLQAFEPENGYILAFSGGKDSIVIYDLAVKSGVKFTPYYNHTTVDPPELVYFMRDKFPQVIVDYPKLTMWELIIRKKFPPTRKMRYCCSYLKEKSFPNNTVITGVRWHESVRRKKARGLIETYAKNIEDKIILVNDNLENRRFFENCVSKSKIIVNPIIDWTNDEVWEYIHKYCLDYCVLYDKGFKRLGCIGCTMAGYKAMKYEFSLYPKYYDAYLRAFDRMLKARKESGMNPIWADAKQVMDWWVGDYTFPKAKDPTLITLDEYMEGADTL